MIMTACNPTEEQEWRTRLAHASARDAQIPSQPMFDSLALNIKALGTVFGKQGTIARRISVHRATTVGPKTPLCQVILKNTSVAPSSSHPSSSSSGSAISINRSMSLLTTNSNNNNNGSNSIPILAPPRGERARLEALLSDVWTRDVLPFPGMTARGRGEYHLVKASATSMMRKLSVASITGSFGRRSHSSAGWRATDGVDGGTHPGGGGGGGGGGRRLVRSEPTLRARGTDSSQQPSVLSSIPDERSYPQVESEWGVDVLRTVGQIIDANKRQREDTDGEVEGEVVAGGQREESPRSKRVKVRRTFSTLTKGRPEVCVSEKQNACVEARRSGRWKAEGVVRGLRSLFQ